MRRLAALAPLLLLAACSPSLEGWWEVKTLSVARDTAKDSRDDAGFALFDDFGTLDLGLSYAFDPLAIAWVPDPDPEVVSYSTGYERTPEGEPDLSMYFLTSSLDTYYLEMDVLDHHNASVVLESLPTYDGTVFRLELER